MAPLEPMSYLPFPYPSFDLRFVATIMHPAFNSSGASRHIEVGEDPITGRQGTLYSVNVSRYLDIPSTKGEAIPGQPETQVRILPFQSSTQGPARLVEILLNLRWVSFISIDRSMKSYLYSSDTHWSWMALRSPRSQRRHHGT